MMNLHGSIWAILPDAMETVCQAAGVVLEQPDLASVARQRAPTARASGSVAVLPVYGTITQRADVFTMLFGGTSTAALGREFDALVADPSVGAIVLDIDSPGGSYSGTPEVAEKIRSSRGSKPIVAQVNTLAASAAYWIASAADSIIATPSADTGSIGVMAVHYDVSEANQQAGVKPTYIYSGRFKVEGNRDEPLTDEARDEIQRRVDQAGTVFTDSVAENRGVSKSLVRNEFGQGRLFSAQESLDRGMIDRVQTLETTIAKLAGKRQATSRRKAVAARHRNRLAELS